jgi:hypothetical protein
VLLHSLVDFPLRIPANMLLLAALWAVITAPATGAVLNQRCRRCGAGRHRGFRLRWQFSCLSS